MPTTSRWLIVAGYLVPLVLLVLTWLILPASTGDQTNDILLSIALLCGIVLGVVLFLAGAITSIAALVRSRDRFHWYDYALLTGAVLPLMAVVLSIFGPF